MHIHLDASKAKKDSKPVVLWFAGSFFVLAGFAVFTRYVVAPMPGVTDQMISETVAQFRFNALDLFLIVFTFLGSTPFIILQAGLVVYWFILRGDRPSANQLIAASSGSIILTEIIKRIFA